MKIDSDQILKDYEKLRKRIIQQILEIPGLNAIPFDFVLNDPDGDATNNQWPTLQVNAIKKTGELICQDGIGNEKIYDIHDLEIMELDFVITEAKKFDLKASIGDLVYIFGAKKLGFVSAIEPTDRIYTIHGQQYGHDQISPILHEAFIAILIENGVSMNPEDVEAIKNYFNQDS